MLNQRRRWVKRAGIALAAMFILWVGLSGFVAWRLTRRPMARFAEPASPIAGAPVEQLQLHTPDGETIGGWFTPPRNKSSVFLILHGIGAARTNHRPLMESLVTEGFGVLSISLRAHGDSTGVAHDVGMSSRPDVIEAVKYLEQHCPDDRIVVCGVSYGAAAAVYAAGELKDRVGAYVLESPYMDLRSAIWNRLQLYLPQIMDRAAYAGLLLWSRAVLPHGIDAYSPINQLQLIPKKTRVYMLAGENDPLALPVETRAMYSSISSHAKLSVFPNAGHVDLFPVDRARYLDILREAAAER